MPRFRTVRRRAGVILASVVATTAAAGAAVVGSGWLDNDEQAPTVRLSAPASGATVSGSVTVSAHAGDNVGVAGVQFRAAGVNIGEEDTSAPYSISWPSTGVANGSVALTAVARDAAGNTKVSRTRTVTVANDADFFVNGSSGNDANPCSEAQPCLTLERGYVVASAGDTVQVDGSLAAQLIDVASKGTPETPVTFNCAPTATIAGVQIKATDNITLVGCTSTGSLNIETNTAGNRASDIVVRDWAGGQFFILGSGPVSIYDSLFDGTGLIGAGSKTDRGTSDFLIPQDILLDGIELIGTTNPEHASDCFHMFEVDGLTIRNSTFDECDSYAILFNKNPADRAPVLIENNYFGQSANMSFAFRTGADHCNIVLRNNSMLHGISVSSSAVFPAECAGTVKVIGNVFAGYTGSPCDSDVVWERNYQYGHAFATNCGTGDAHNDSVVAADLFVGPTASPPDLRLKDGVTPIGLANGASQSPATDFYGTVRPVGLLDAGAHER